MTHWCTSGSAAVFHSLQHLNEGSNEGQDVGYSTSTFTTQTAALNRSRPTNLIVEVAANSFDIIIAEKRAREIFAQCLVCRVDGRETA